MFKIIKNRFSKRKRLAKKQPEILRYEELEQRVLFSADVVPGLDTAAVEEQVIVQDVANEVQVEREAASETVEQTAEKASSELVLVNENVTDYKELIADLQSSDNNRIIEVVVLESDRDGIEQVSEILSERSDLAAVHFISHGSDGRISLGDSWLTSTTLQQNSDAVADWGNALSETGDILFYGCKIAADSDGQGLLDNIAELTGADVIASDDLTGNAALGGDWDLEYRTGSVEASVALDAAAQAEYQGVLDAYVVSNTDATGFGSLHQAITDANANTGVTDTITFNIGGGGPQTIAVDAAGLPIITDSVILDATTQSGYSGTPLITLDGSATPASSGINGITLRANDSTVKGFIVIKFADEGIEMDGSTGFGDNNIIQNNWVGIDAAGNVAGNAEHGIMISADASGNQIGGTGPNEGNVVAGNGFSGVIINENSDNNIVEGNIIGIKPDGTTPAGNGTHGILIQLSSDGNRIGGTTAGAGNIIAGNTQDGIYIDGTTDATYTTVSSGTVIQGNWVGTTGTGSTGVGNGNTGINVEGANTIIGGTGANEGNVITNNGNEGINVAGTGATGTIIQGNFIGLDPDGSTGSGNTDVGIALLSGAHNTTIGGTTAAARNVISNNKEGIEINSDFNVVQGNYIGTDGGGTLDRGNHSDDGIEIKNGATGNLVGGTVAGAGNLIAFNALDGVNLVSGSGNSVIGNQIHSNSGLGIDLGTSGVTANDTGDADAGSNDLQNFPVITQAELSGTNQTLSGSIDTDGLNTQYRIEFFGNAVGTQDPTHGEGRYYLGTTTVTTNGSGDGTFSNVTLTDVSLNVGDYVTATATVIDNPAQVGIDDQLAYGSTSEFAANVAIVDSNTAPTTSGITDFSANEDFVSFINLYPHFADAEDADSALVYTIENNTNPALFDATTINASGVLTLDYAADQNGTADITIRATDTGGLYVETTFTVTVNPVNDAPTISVTNSTPTFTENGGAVSLFSDTSVDPVEAGDLIDTLQITVDSLADGNNEIIVVDGQNIELTHLNNETTATSGYDVSVSVSGTTATVVITKTGGFSAAAAETLINGVAYNNTSENPQGAVRMVTLISIKDDGGTTNGGADTKGIGISSLVTISAVNDDPTNIGSLPADVTVTEDVTSSVNLSAVIFSDVDAGTNLITVTLTTSTGGRIWASSDFDVIVSGSGTGTVTLIGGVADLNNFFSSASRVQYLHGTPHTEGDNADTIKVEINDGGNTGSGGGGTINLGTVNVDISAVNDAPAGTDNTVSTNEDTDYVFVAGDFGFGDPNDSPADNFANVIITTTVANGTLYVDANDDGLVDGGEAISDLDTVSVADITAGRLKFKPAANANGTGYDSFTFQVQDDGAGADTDLTPNTMTIDVAAVNDAPTITAIADQTIAEDGTTGALAFTVGDVETAAGSLTVTASSSNTTIIPNGNLTLVDLGSGNWTIAASPAPNQNGGPVTITVTVDDGTTTTDETFDITVTPDNDAPTITAIADQTIAEDGTTGALAFTVGDVETAAGSLTVTASSSNTTIIPNGNLTLIDLGSGNWTIEATPALNQNGGPVTITVTVDDGTTTTDETFDITVTPDNDAPTITAIADQTIAEDGTTGALAFTVGDVETSAGSLTVTASSSNTTIIPNGNLTLVDLGSGNWTIAASPAPNQNGGPVTITVTVDDGTTTTDETFDITVTPDNDAPTITAIADQTIAEDGTTGAMAFTVGDVETAAGSLTVTASSSNTTIIPDGNLTLVDLGSGNWTIEATPALNQNGGPVTITVTVDDGTTTTDETFDITVTPDNDAPTITAIADQTIAEDGTTGALAFTVGDVETAAGSLTVTASSSNTTIIPDGNLTLVDLGSGNWTIEATPALNQNGGPVTITVTVDDDTTTTDATFDITVTPDNDAPTITAITDQTIAEDGTTGALAFTVGDVETGAGSLTVTASSSNTTIIPNGNLTLVDLGSGNWTIAASPAPNQNGGPVTITVTVDDGTTTTDETFDITVTPDNDAPTITAIADQTIAEDGTTGALAFTVGDVETAAGSLTVTATSNNTTLIPNGNLTLVDLGSGNWTIEAVPATNQSGGPVTITVTVDDGTTTTDETFTVTVTADNDAPTISAIANQTIVEDGTTGALAFSVSDVETADGSLTVTATSSNTTLIPNGNLTLVDLGSGSWTIEATPALNQNGGPVTITVTVDDGTTTTDETFTVTVTADNDAPTISAIADQTIAEDGTTGALAFNVSDVETVAGSLTVTASSSNTTLIPNGNLTLVDLGSGSWTIEATPALNQNGEPVTITVTVDDGTTTTDETFDINVTPDNDTPTITAIADQTIVEDGTTGALAFTVGDVETSAGSLTVTASSSNTTIIPDGNLTLVDLGSGNWTIEATPSLNQNGGPVTITVTVDDGTATTDETFNVTVTANNDAPLINDVTFGLNENSTNGTAIGTVSVTDPDAGDTHVYTITAGNTGGAFAIDNAGNITVANSAALNFETTPVFTLTVQVQDQGGTGIIDTATITVNLNNLNEAPISFGIGNVTVSEDAPNTVIDLFAAFADTEDADANLTYTITANTKPGLFAATPIDGVAGTLTLDYAPNANGTANITVRATDTSALWVESTFTVTVNPDNDAPATTPVNLTAISEDGGGRLITQAELLANATDVDGPALTATNLTISAGSGTLVDNGNGTWAYTPAANDDTSVSFTHTVTDGSLTAAGSATLDITPVNDAPVTNNDSATVDEGQNVVINLVGNDADVENALDLSSITITAAPTNGTLVDNGDGTLTYGHDGSKTISDRFSYTINDVSGATSNIAAVSLTVNPDNDNDPADSTDPNPTLEGPVTDEDEDSDVESPTYEAPGKDPLAEDEPLLLVEEYQAPEDSGDADESIVVMKDPQDEVTQDIVYLTDEIDRDAQPEGREDDRGYTYYDNDLYKDISLSKYLNFNGFAAENEPVAVSLDDISFLDFDSDDTDPVNLNEDYDLLRQEIDESFNSELESQGIKAKIVTATAATFTVGIVSYLLRAGSMVASMMSALPLWRGFDPIAIFSGNKKKKKKQDEISDAGELKPEAFFDGDAE